MLTRRGVGATRFVLGTLHDQLWSILQHPRLLRFHFQRVHQIEDETLEFYSPRLRIMVEIDDGGVSRTTPNEITVVRVHARHVKSNPWTVIRAIESAARTILERAPEET